MSFDLKSISTEATYRAPRMLLVGTEKIGKTSFATGCTFKKGSSKPTNVGTNSPIVLPLAGEEGADALAVAKFPTISSYEELVEALGALCSEEHEHKTIVLDSLSSLGPLIEKAVCSEANVTNIRKVPGFKTGEAACEIKWRTILNAFDYLRNTKNMATIVICHTKVRKFKNPEGEDWDKYDIDCEPYIAEMLKRWADLILFCNTKVFVKVQGEDGKFSVAKKTAKDITGGARFLYTQQRPQHPGGGRTPYGDLPYEMDLNWAVFEKEVAKVFK